MLTQIHSGNNRDVHYKYFGVKINNQLKVFGKNDTVIAKETEAAEKFWIWS